MKREYKEVLAEMADIGTGLNREDVLECFNEQALRLFISEQEESSTASTMFARLRKSVDARAEIHELERGMDKDHFVELVTKGNFMAGGVDKQTNFPIFWYRSGLLHKNSWNYEFGSSRGKAFIRYALKNYFMCRYGGHMLSASECEENQTDLLTPSISDSFSCYSLS